MSTIAVSKTKVEKHKGVIILPLKEYRELLERAVPTYYLTGKAAERLDKLVERGLKEYREGKTIDASSLKAALAQHRGKRKHAR